MRTEQFVSGRGDRSGNQNIAVILTDGESKVTIVTEIFTML